MAYVVKQDKFEGPLELLLDLIDKEKLSISEISLAKVTDGYIKHLKTLGKIDPEELAEFLVIAAELLLIKSKTLLPNLKLSEEEEVSIDELEMRLKKLQQIRELMKELREVESKKRYILTREAYFGMEPVFYPPPKLNSSVLAQIFRSFLASLPKIERLAEEKIKKIISLEEKIMHIRSFLQDTIERAFSDLVLGTKEKVEVIVSFLAILELAKQRFVELKQDKIFADIRIKRL